MRSAVAAVGVAAGLLVLAGCSPADPAEPAGGSGAGPSLTVVAAASLTEPFTEMGRRFEEAHPGAEVQLAFASSPSVAAQVRAGAPADVVATADRGLADALAAEGLTGPVRTFARNRLTIAVAPGNPLAVRTVDDLARADLDLVVCAPEVPCGRLAALALAAATTRPRPRSYEADVKAVLARLVMGEADAGLVYVTDVRAAAGRVDAVPMARGELVADYALARVAASTDGDGAQAFVDFVGSPAGLQVLSAAGFEGP